MREEHGQLAGDMVVYEPCTLWGSVGGNVSVVEGGKFYCRGTIYGNLSVEFGGRVHIFGNILGNLSVVHGGKVIHEGIITGNATNDGGRLFIEPAGEVRGKIKTITGDTVNKSKRKDS
ncbi:MAG: hypothetical protein JO353_04175 [Phycisphaerae bacterium]|nr:hypothetical protein [Phycisphaerae bacterium]